MEELRIFDVCTYSESYGYGSQIIVAKDLTQIKNIFSLEEKPFVDAKDVTSRFYTLATHLESAISTTYLDADQKSVITQIISLVLPKGTD